MLGSYFKLICCCHTRGTDPRTKRENERKEKKRDREKERKRERERERRENFKMKARTGYRKSLLGGWGKGEEDNGLTLNVGGNGIPLDDDLFSLDVICYVAFKVSSSLKESSTRSMMSTSR